MRVQILMPVASTTGTYRKGEIVELPDELARQWIASGTAKVEEEQKPPKPAARKRKQP